jgi:integrase
MARPRLEIGTWGKIGYITEGDRVRAYASYRFDDGTTAKRERWGANEEEARRRLLKYLRSLGGKNDQLSRSSTVEELATKWLGVVRDQEQDTTFLRYQSAMKKHVVPAVGALGLHECKTSRLQKVIDDMQKRNYSYGTCSMAKVVMKAMFQWAVLEELMDYNPARELRKIKRTDRKRKRAFDQKDLQEFLAAVDADKYMKVSYLPDLLRFLFGTGCRVGEALAVRWIDLNLSDEPVFVHSEVFGDQELPPRSVWINGNIVHGIGGLVRHDGKTDASEGVLPLPEFLVDLLRFRLPQDAKPEDPVFPNHKGSWRGPNGVMDSVRRLRVRIDHPDFSTKWGRKTVSTWLRTAGLSAEDNRDQLRHSSVTTAEKHYTVRKVNRRAGVAIDQLMKPEEVAAS